MSNIPDSNVTSPASQYSFKDAFEKTTVTRDALTPEELLAINLDVQGVVTSVIQALPRIKPLRDRMVALPEFKIENVDTLPTLIDALAYAHSRHLAASQPVEPLPALVARATALRELLLSDATALAKRNLIDGRRLEELNGGPGYMNICSDVSVLVEMLRERWSEIAGKTAIQMSEIDEANKLFEKITWAYGERSTQSMNAVAATDARHRAYTLLLNAYDQTRRAVGFLRWSEGDADKIAPSLFAGRRRVGSTSTPDAPDGQDVSPAAGAPAPVAAANDASHAAAPAPAGSGLPGGSPFNAN